ncbi:MAG: amidophosphoribosyltransferase [Rikenellaceae bacterium]|jgi:amidophosphoribosyltransferase|nr:amidophosphoribosyltransferase [Rikenellaceae bacterium]
MEQLKHECGLALVVLRKPVQYYKERYGAGYALDKLYLLMEKQHNRGQEGAGAVCINSDGAFGSEFMFRERAEGSDAITKVFSAVEAQIARGRREGTEPFSGNIYMGHLRYSTTGRSGLSFVHPFLRRSSHKMRNLALCGNFNLTNVDELLTAMKCAGQHPRSSADTFVILEQIGEALDEQWRFAKKIDFAPVLREASPAWDGGYVICGATGSGETFTLRDPWGVRTAFVYVGEEIVAVASERPVLQTAFNIDMNDIRELEPGEAVVTTAEGGVSFEQILPRKRFSACSFERIYFSRGSDSAIYRERKSLGSLITPSVIEALGGNLLDAVFSYIPNTAEVAFLGMVDALEDCLNNEKAQALEAGMSRERTHEILSRRIRMEKVAIKDIKLRTFISDTERRKKLAAHVYDVTYGSLRPGQDTLVIIDDSIVRGTTLRESIISILARLGPREIVIISSAPQIRYPDYYGIDMPRLEELIAFRAAASLLEKSGRGGLLREVYERSKGQRGLPAERVVNYVQDIYKPFTDGEIADEIAAMLKPDSVRVGVKIIFQSLDALHMACPDHPGDWYFSGDYPTPGGNRLVNEAFISYYENNYK